MTRNRCSRRERCAVPAGTRVAFFVFPPLTWWANQIPSLRDCLPLLRDDLECCATAFGFLANEFRRCPTWGGLYQWGVSVTRDCINRRLCVKMTGA